MTFEREDRYLVLKYKDIEKYLDKEAFVALARIAAEVDKGRRKDGKDITQAVVVEYDWPEYEVVWKMLENRCKGE